MVRAVSIAGMLGAVVLAGASQLAPPVLPLIVRNPYLSTWLADARKPPWEHWPMFWGGQNIGFTVMATIPGSNIVYPLLGRPQDSFESGSTTVAFPEYNGYSYDASTTNLTYGIHSDASQDSSTINITLSFVSPITPSSMLRQSLPAAYLAIHVKGKQDVSIYTDISGDWVSGNRDNEISWDMDEQSCADGSNPCLKSWKVSRTTQQLFSEVNDRAEWGSLLFTAPADVNHKSGHTKVLRHHFAVNGTLNNETDRNYRRINTDDPAFAFSKTFPLHEKTESRLGRVGEDGILVTLALVQDPVVQYAAARGLTYMRPLWASYLPNAEQMIQFHYHDFSQALSLAQNFSAQLVQDAQKSISTEYADIVSLSARQVLGSTQFSGTPESPIIFLKEISSNGNFQTVDVIFPAFPFFLYTNPQWLAYLLDPLIEHQLSGQYPNNYSMHDLGAHFPNATAHPDGRDEYMPVEECGNMLIMGLALINALSAGSHPVWLAPTVEDSVLAQVVEKDRAKTGSTSLHEWVSKSYELWKRWAGYLVRESLIPRNQLCTDDFAGWLANQTNLALKGIIGIRAMSEISGFLGQDDDAEFYRNISDSYIEKWQDFGISRDGTHAKLSYTWYGSWTTLYNLYADALLCFHLQEPSFRREIHQDQQPLVSSKRQGFVPGRIYKMQSKWYKAVLQHYGLPLDSRHLYTKSDWQFFAAAVAGSQTREAMVERIATWVDETITDRPFTDLYDTEGKGDFSPVRFMARPVVGGHFASLALDRACGGQGRAGLSYLDEDEDEAPMNVAASLAHDAEHRVTNSQGSDFVTPEEL